jgi:hypothetical protein
VHRRTQLVGADVAVIDVDRVGGSCRGLPGELGCVQRLQRAGDRLEQRQGVVPARLLFGRFSMTLPSNRTLLRRTVTLPSVNQISDHSSQAPSAPQAEQREQPAGK